MKINYAKRSMNDWPRETEIKRDICTFDYSIRVMDNLCRLNLTRPTGNTSPRINGYQEPISGGYPKPL